MTARMIYALLFTGSVVLMVLSIGSVLAASNAIGESGADVDSFPITANDLKPTECAALDLISIVASDGDFRGTDQNELVLGGAGADKIDSKGGNDCVLGGGGDDELKGQDEDDVILGGPGNDKLDGGKQYDVCYGGTGTDEGKNCEVEYEIP
jgi:Ca2+-binding RTX toxin-like protein